MCIHSQTYCQIVYFPKHQRTASGGELVSTSAPRPSPLRTLPPPPLSSRRPPARSTPREHFTRAGVCLTAVTSGCKKKCDIRHLLPQHRPRHPSQSWTHKGDGRVVELKYSHSTRGQPWVGSCVIGHRSVFPQHSRSALGGGSCLSVSLHLDGFPNTFQSPN